MNSTDITFTAIILAAGTGKRLGTVGQKIPKPLVEFRPQLSILEYNLLSMYKVDLFEKIVVVAGYMESAIHEVIKRIALNEYFQIEHVVNPYYRSESVLYSVELGLKVAGMGNILLMNGDTIFSPTIYDTIKQIIQVNGVPYCSILGSLRSTHKSDDVMIQLDNSNHIMQVGKDLPSADAISSGMVLLSEPVRSLYEKKLQELKSEKSAIHHDIVNLLCRDGASITFISTPLNEWLEIDTLDDLNSARNIFG